MRNIRLKIAYDGTDFCGWQIQKDLPTIQECIKTAIGTMTLEDVKVIGAGRTDSGVHAVGQVANFLTESRIPALGLANGINAMVPDGITVLDAEDVPLTFHSQFHAIRKRYRYLIDNSRRPFPFLKRYSFHARNRLDVDSMHTAAQILMGEHDFRAFESNFPNRASSVRTISEISVKRFAGWPFWMPGALPLNSAPVQPDPSGDFICIDVVADGFLYNMVRCISGTLLEVGRGKWENRKFHKFYWGKIGRQQGLLPRHRACF